MPRSHTPYPLKRGNSKNKKWKWCRPPSVGVNPIPKNCIWQTSISSWTMRAASPCKSLAHTDSTFRLTAPLRRKVSSPTSNRAFAKPGLSLRKASTRPSPANEMSAITCALPRPKRRPPYAGDAARPTRKTAGNLRSAVEATVRSVKHPFPAAKLPVRGLFRVACMVIGSAAITNLRRIERYLKAENQKETAPMADSTGKNEAAVDEVGAFGVHMWAKCAQVLGCLSATRSILAC